MILVNTPIIDILNNSDPVNYESVIQIYKNYASSNESVYYWDFNPDFSHNYLLFYDPIHMNPGGQEIITSEIVSNINSLHLK